MKQIQALRILLTMAIICGIPQLTWAYGTPPTLLHEADLPLQLPLHVSLTEIFDIPETEGVDGWQVKMLLIATDAKRQEQVLFSEQRNFAVDEDERDNMQKYQALLSVSAALLRQRIESLTNEMPEREFSLRILVQLLKTQTHTITEYKSDFEISQDGIGYYTGAKSPVERRVKERLPIELTDSGPVRQVPIEFNIELDSAALGRGVTPIAIEPRQLSDNQSCESAGAVVEEFAAAGVFVARLVRFPVCHGGMRYSKLEQHFDSMKGIQSDKPPRIVKTPTPYKVDWQIGKEAGK